MASLPIVDSERDAGEPDRPPGPSSRITIATRAERMQDRPSLDQGVLDGNLCNTSALKPGSAKKSIEVDSGPLPSCEADEHVEVGPSQRPIGRADRMHANRSPWPTPTSTTHRTPEKSVSLQPRSGVRVLQ